MTISNINFQFGVTGVPAEKTFSTRQDIKKRVENILYLQSPPEDAVKVSYVGSKELSAENNLHIADRSYSLFENSKKTKDIEIIGDSSTLSIFNTNFLITQHFHEDDSTLIPLYYKHILHKDIVASSVVVLDSNYKKADLSSYKLERHLLYDEDGFPTGQFDEYRLYNSFETGLNRETGEYEVYFVQYVLGNQTYTEILNGEPAYKEASIEDIWFLTGELKPWEDVYSVDSESLTVTLAAVTKHAIRYLGSRKMELLQPAGGSVEDPWFPRITNDVFNSGFGGDVYKYEIKEFKDQSFQPMEPYKLGIRQKCVKLSKSLLALPNVDIDTGEFSHSIDIIVETKDEEVLYALTSDKTKNGTLFVVSAGKEIYWSSDRFLGVDKRAGIVHFDADILDSYNVFATYTYRESNYTLNTLALNPTFGQGGYENSPSYLHCVYIVPTSTPNKNILSQKTSVHFLKISQSGIIVDATQVAASGNENIRSTVEFKDTDGKEIKGALWLPYSRRASSKLTSNVTLAANAELPLSSVYGFPESNNTSRGWIRGKDSNGIYRHMRYGSIQDNKLILSPSVSQVPVGSLVFNEGTTIELVNFLDQYTTLSTRNLIDENDSFDVAGSWPSVYSRYFVLGELTVNPPHGINETAVIDVREDGGGIKKELYEEAKELNPKAQWLNNIYPAEGQPTPGNAVVVIKLPGSILNTYSLDNLQDIVLQSIPFGVYPVIEFSGYRPRILEVHTDSNSVTVTWPKEKQQYIYSVWRASNPNGPWTQQNMDIILDDPDPWVSFNSFSVGGLTPDKTYYIKIEAQEPPFSNLINFKFQILE